MSTRRDAVVDAARVNDMSVGKQQLIDSLVELADEYERAKEAFKEVLLTHAPQHSLSLACAWQELMKTPSTPIIRGSIVCNVRWKFDFPTNDFDLAAMMADNALHQIDLDVIRDVPWKTEPSGYIKHAGTVLHTEIRL